MIKRAVYILNNFSEISLFLSLASTSGSGLLFSQHQTSPMDSSKASLQNLPEPETTTPREEVIQRLAKHRTTADLEIVPDADEAVIITIHYLPV